MDFNLFKNLEEGSKSSDEKKAKKQTEIAKELKLVKSVWNNEKIDRDELSPYGHGGHKNTKFKAASDVYFREYVIPEDGYFEEDKPVLVGKHPLSFKEKTGIPDDQKDGKKAPEFYTYFTYPQLEADL